jgi:hypothetical protein
MTADCEKSADRPILRIAQRSPGAFAALALRFQITNESRDFAHGV